MKDEKNTTEMLFAANYYIRSRTRTGSARRPDSSEPPFDKHLVIDDSIRELQIAKINKLRSDRNSEKAKECLANIGTAAKGTSNLMPFIIEAVENYCTLGEVADAMRGVFGEYK